MKYDTLFSERMKNISGSAIRELLKVAQKHGMISFAGGLPAPGSFPVGIIRKLSGDVIEKYGADIFQYSFTEGFPPFRNAMRKYLAREKGIEVSENLVCISTGAQTALDGIGKVLLNKGDVVATESPTFLGALKTFRAYEPEFVKVESDEGGMVPESLEDVAKAHKIKMVYIIPNFNNPTGATLSHERREKIAEIAKKYQLIIVEDDPYFELRYEGENIPSLHHFARENVVYVGSLSKILSPGMRLGYYTGPEEIITQISSVRQGVDVHANVFAQAIAEKYMRDYLSSHIKGILSMYKSRRDVMNESIRTHFPSEFSVSEPKGGMFFWVRGPEEFDAVKVYEEAVSRNVAYVPGKFFYIDEVNGNNTFRLNFTNVSEDKIREGIEILAEVLREK